MAPIRDSVSHSPSQTGLDHAGLDPQYENSSWSSGSTCSDSNSNWGTALVDGCTKGSWPFATRSELELVSECMDADSASSSGSERNLGTMASGMAGGDGSRQGNGQGSHFLLANSSNNLVNGSVKSPWGGSMLSTCSAESPSDKLADGGHGKMNAWGTQGPSTNGGINPSTLNPNANRGAWPVLQNNGPNSHVPLGKVNGGTNTQRSTIGQAPGMQSVTCKMPWGGLQEGVAESEVNGSSKVLSGHPQNLNTEFNGPNNTTNTMTSSLPNSTGSVETPERGWPTSTGGSPRLPTPPVSNGTSDGSYGAAWGAPPGTTYSGDKCPVPKGQAVGDTVNATLMQSTANGPPAAFKSNNGVGGRGGGWDSAPAPSQTMTWGAGNGMGPPGAPHPWGSASSSSSSSSSSSNTGTKVAGDWAASPGNNQHSNEGDGRKGTNGWKSLEDDALGLGGAQSSQGSTWNKSTGSEGSGESSGARSDRGGQRDGGHRTDNQQNVRQADDADVSKVDVDPRVLSNQGWGQTPVRQNIAWDVKNPERKPGNGSQGWANPPPQQSTSQGGWGDGPGTNTSDNCSSNWGEKKSSGWAEAKSQNGWDEPSGGMSKRGSSWGNCRDEKSSTWNNGPKTKQGWGGSSSGEGSRGNHWNETSKSGSGGWDRDGDSDRSGSGWGDNVHSNKGNTWGGSAGTNAPDQGGPTTGWGDPAKSNNQNQGWGEPIKASHSNPAWDDSTRSSNPSEWGKKGQDASTGTFRAESGPQNHAQNKPSGWIGGPVPSPQKEKESSGWEEPSPESIRRRMEIDDGTSAWGDPGKYKYSNVNLWNKNTSAEQDDSQQAPPPPAPSSMVQKEKSSSSGWGESYPAPQKMKPPPSWADPAVDKGTSAWGKSMDSSWEDPGRESAAGSGWGSQAQHKPGPKPVQESWNGEMMPMPSNWDEEKEPEIGMWNNNAAQEVNQSGNWSYMKKVPPKVNKGPGKPDDLCMNQFVNQFSNMNFPRDSEDHMNGKKMDISSGMLDKRMDVDKHAASMAEFVKPSVSRGALHKDSSPYMDKNVHMYGGGNVAAQGRSSQQPPAQPLGSAQPNLRNQVPPPLLPSQVPPSLLKYPPGNGGLNPLFNPQQMAMLNQLSQLNQLNQLSQISQLQRLLLQQKAQNQRLVPGSNRHTPDQQARAVGMCSMVPPPRHIEPPLLKQHSPPQPAALHQPKSYMDAFMNPNAPDLHKDQHLLNSFSNFPLGLNSNMNVNNLDLGGVGFKEPQSRLKKWTAMDVTVNSPLDQNPSKPGAMSSLRIDDAPFGPYDLINSSNSPISPPDPVGDGWPTRAKSPHASSNVNWPPEFRPGEPWKGYPNIDPETDPFVTPGSVINSLSINTVRDVDHLRDRNNGPSSSLNTTLPSNSAWTSIRASNHTSSLSSTAQSTSARSSDSKWSPGSVSHSSLAHELWKVPLSSKGVSAPSRPPPGLTSQKQSSSWGGGSLRLGGWGSSEPRYTPGSSWGESSSGRTNWLVLKNLTPQIDGSTLRTLCMQHGPLITFHLSLPHGTALVCYNSRDEAAKAQKSLHMCVLGNTTILADFASEDEINRFFAQGQPLGVSSGWQNLASSQSRLASDAFSSGADLPSSSMWGAPAYSSSLWSSGSCSDGGNRLASPSPMASFLPVDHLTGSGDSM
ncbi:trinucleotide repeat-containing gene 6A protein-like isoform X2 [Trichomycterus rosablanca]